MKLNSEFGCTFQKFDAIKENKNTRAQCQCATVKRVKTKLLGIN